MIGPDGMKRRSGFGVDAPVVAVVRAAYRRTDQMLVEDARAPAGCSEGLGVAFAGIFLGNAVVPSDWPARGWRRGGQSRLG